MHRPAHAAGRFCFRAENCSIPPLGDGQARAFENVAFAQLASSLVLMKGRKADTAGPEPPQRRGVLVPALEEPLSLSL
jgi:hypothetical protein